MTPLTDTILGEKQPKQTDEKKELTWTEVNPQKEEKYLREVLGLTEEEIQALG